MPDTNDMHLLREYCAEQSEPAFETLVDRHVNLVYATALRRIGNPAQAEEITQAVFVILARKAACLPPETILPAWLHETARYVTASYLRGEIRRRQREQEAYMQSTLHPSSDDATWEQLAPLLDEAIGRLGTADRNVVVLSYFQNKSAQEIATALNVGEAAARKRLTRAVEKLRLYFVRRGINVSTSAVSGAVSAHSVLMAPTGLAKTAAATALVKGSVASASTLTLVKGALKLMAWTKIKTTIAGTAVVLLAAAATMAVVEEEIYGRPIFNHISDATIRQLAVGTWQPVMPTSSRVETTTVNKPDGSFSTRVMTDRTRVTNRLAYTGSWGVKDGYMTSQITNVMEGDKNWLPLGVLRFKVIQVDGREMVLQQVGTTNLDQLQRE